MKHDRYLAAKKQQEALLYLSKNQWRAGYRSILDSLHLATSTATKVLDIQRCSVWLYEDNKSKIKCIDLYDSEVGKHESDMILTKEDFPNYFKALLSERIISADDACNDEYTSEFCDVYLKPLGISSMLDAPIWLGGDVIGVLCCEHVGESRKWDFIEQNFAVSVADFVSISYELSKHKKTSDELRRHQDHLENIVLERTRELEKKNKDLEAFNYSLSHDIRTPLNVVLGYLEILEATHCDNNNIRGRDYINKAISGAKQINVMIDSMLKLSRISSAKLHCDEINLSSLMEDIYEQFLSVSKSITFDIQETPVANVDIDIMRIALTNLLENAIKYSKNTTKPSIIFGAKKDKNKVVYFIKDNGCGFDMKNASNLFEEFKRLHTDEEYQGMGIGLSTVQRIINKHGGEIWADSSPGNGATFYFNL